MVIRFQYERCSMKINLANQNTGFSLVEILIATMILVITTAGLGLTYIKYLEVNEIAANFSSTLHASKNIIETIKNTPFSQIAATHNNQTFTITDLNGIGTVVIDSTNSELLQVTVSFCWRNRNERQYGEDANLNGIIDAGEDTNGNGILDSPIQLTTYIYAL